MTLSELFALFPHIGETSQQTVTGLAVDSRLVQPGFVFIALRGTGTDGHEFLANACERGAIALVVESRDAVPTQYRGSVVQVLSTREALGPLAAHFYDFPSERVCCIGVTGTNGKTSTTFLIEHILNENGWPTGVMGTIDHHFENHKWPTTLTTPDAIQLEHRVSEMVQLGAKCLAFEVSSHALAQRRVDGVSFDIGIFTNLTRDHLDYHKDMEDYFHAKERLFFNVLQNSKKNRVFAIINTDDEWGTKLRLGPRVQKISYGQRADDFRFKILKGDVAGTHFELIANREKHDGFLPMPGPHNVANAMAALAAASVLGVTIEQGLESLSQFPGVPGRLERVERRAPFAVFVDYAHTPDALENVVRTLRPLTKDLCVLFGCGGDRDKGKRPLMLQTALNGSDQVVLTSDNPRTEDPMLIIEDSLRGVAFDPVRIHVEVDRKKAIEWALNRAKAGSVVLIAGKGHEDYQLIGSKKLAFSDQKVVREILAMKWNLQ